MGTGCLRLPVRAPAGAGVALCLPRGAGNLPDLADQRRLSLDPASLPTLATSRANAGPQPKPGTFRKEPHGDA